MDQAQQQRIVDRIDIIDVFNRYATGVDMRDHDIYRACFTDQLDVNITGDSVSFDADRWVDQALTALANFEQTQHMISNHSIVVQGDEAEAIAYLQAHHFNKDSTWSVWGRYINRLSRTPDGWRISHLKLVM